MDAARVPSLGRAKTAPHSGGTAQNYQITAIAAIVDVELAVLSGGVARSGDLLLSDLRQRVAAPLAFPPAVEMPVNCTRPGTSSPSRIPRGARWSCTGAWSARSATLPLDKLGVRVAGLDPKHGEDGASEPFGRGQVRDGDGDVLGHHAEALAAGVLTSRAACTLAEQASP
jgi:hypothetical protein